ncbi:hypothetical protein AAKU55_003516 [Oxalobacteraceae bacterium GrIS 1.11]
MRFLGWDKGRGEGAAPVAARALHTTRMITIKYDNSISAPARQKWLNQIKTLFYGSLDNGNIDYYQFFWCDGRLDNVELV